MNNGVSVCKLNSTGGRISKKRYHVNNGIGIIEKGITEIETFAFVGCEFLREINIPPEITKIGDAAFNYCTALQRVIIPESVMEIGDFAFGFCSSLTDLIIPSSVKKIGTMAFHCCKALSKIRWGDKDISIINVDGFCLEVLSKRNIRGYTISRCIQIPDKIECYLASYKNLYTRGDTVDEVIKNLQWDKKYSYRKN